MNKAIIAEKLHDPLKQVMYFVCSVTFIRRMNHQEYKFCLSEKIVCLKLLKAYKTKRVITLIIKIKQSRRLYYFVNYYKIVF